MNDRPSVGRGRLAALQLAAFCAALPPAPPVPLVPTPGVPRPRPEWAGREHSGHSHGNGKLRKGHRPKVKAWSCVQEIPPGQVEMRLAAGQRLERRPDGVWIWPVSDQRRYQAEHP